MTAVSTIMADCTRTMWGIGLCVTIPTNIIAYIVFLIYDTNVLVDFQWAANQFWLAVLCFALRETHAAYAYLEPADTLLGKASVRNILSLVFMFLWAARLAGFILVTRACKGENDARYEALARGGEDKKPKSSDPEEELVRKKQEAEEGEAKRKKFFFFQFLFQAILVVFPATPIYFVFAYSEQTNIEKQWSFWVGLAIAAFGVVNTTISDYQVEQYKHEQQQKRLAEIAADPNSKPTKGLCRVGWWSKSRHPNLFFEVITWIGFAILGIDENSLISIFGLVGPVLLFLIMKYVTVPVTEDSMKKTRPNWEELIADTNMFLPFC